MEPDQPDEDREQSDGEVTSLAESDSEESTKSCAKDEKHETDDMVPTKALYTGALSIVIASELDTGQPPVTAAPIDDPVDTTGKSLDARKSSSDTVLHQGRSQSAVTPQSVLQLKLAWEKRGDMVPAGIWHW